MANQVRQDRKRRATHPLRTRRRFRAQVRLQEGALLAVEERVQERLARLNAGNYTATRERAKLARIGA